MTATRVPAITEQTSPLQAALAYAQAGWYVIPVDRSGTGKNPGSILGGDWPRKSSRDPDLIREWFSSAWPERNIALHVGRSGAVAFDHDKGDLPQTLRKAIGDTGAPRQSTPSGGAHYLFRQPPGRTLGNSTGKLGSDWGEVRGSNGVIVVPPSVSADDPTRTYRWATTEATPVPVLPDSVSGLLPDAGQRDRTATVADRTEFLERHDGESRPEMLTAVTDYYRKRAHAGSRHETLVHCACWAMREARAGFYPAQLAYERLWAEFEQSAGRERYIESEFAGVVDWAIGQVRALTEEQLAQQLERDGSAVPEEEIDEYEARLMDTYALDRLPDPKWLITGWLETDSVARMVGKSRHGKSFVALDMAAHIGQGLAWNGHRATQGEVIYLAAEGAYGMKKRVRAWEAHHARRMRGVLIFPEAIQVGRREWRVFVELIRRRRPALVVLDTQARITVGLEENSATDMGVFVDRMEQLRAASDGSCVMPVHHLGHSGREGRGSTAVTGAVTSEIRVERDEDSRLIQVETTKQKNAEDGLELRFELCSVKLGHDSAGDPATSAVLRRVCTPDLDRMLSMWREMLDRKAR